MYAVIETGGKQYRVQEGDVITIEKLPVEADSKIEFDKVLVLGEGADINVGAPYIDGAKVFGSVVENGKGQKVIIFKYKSKKDYRKKQGHRQPYTMVKITGVGKDEPANKSADPKAEAVSKAVPAEEAKETKSPSIKSMKKDELIAFAKEHNIAIDEKATKPVIIEAIKAALK